LLLAIVAAGKALRGGLSGLLGHSDDFLLITWILITIILIYLPFVTQQRRFSAALFVPIAILAARGLDQIPLMRPSLARVALLAASSLTNLVLLLVLLLIPSVHPPFFLFKAGCGIWRWAVLPLPSTDALFS
jgi:hypothetical protein